VTTAEHDPFADVGALLSRAVAKARAVFAGPDGPIALGLGLGLIAMAEVTLYASNVESAMIANLFATLPLALLRRQLAVTAGLVVFGIFLALGDGSSTLTVAALLSLVFVLYLFAARYRRRWSVLIALPFLVNAVTPVSGDYRGFPSVLLLLVVVAALALGDSRRERGEAIAERDETRRAMADTLYDHAAMGERTRIARDLHDIVAHHVSAIAVQAESARLTTPGLPEQGREQLEAIGNTARDALDEMRRLLGVLREDDGAASQRAPQPGLAQLGELVDTARAAGTSVELTVSGRVVALPPGIDLCAYRILQEALTNARRHAPGAAVEVSIRYGASSLKLRVRDHGPGASETEPDGHGLLGMRERAIMVGGTLSAGAASGDGFVVEAELPVPVPAA
jgi:signal transduction histidine kinase